MGAHVEATKTGLVSNGIDAVDLCGNRVVGRGLLVGVDLEVLQDRVDALQPF
jgi:hypothetical protein